MWLVKNRGRFMSDARWLSHSTIVFKLPQWLQVISVSCYLPRVDGFVMIKRKALRNICCLSHDILVVKLKMFAIGVKKVLSNELMYLKVM